MTLLNQSLRPWVAFDPTIKDHRRYYAEFKKHRSWGTCPVRFVLHEDAADAVSMIEKSLADYYTNKEFAD